jgi:hypothetical protein
VLGAAGARSAVVSSLASYRIELGASDDAFLLGNPSSWGRAYEDSGPFRLRRGERRMTYFAARMAFPEAGIRVPARVEGAGAELRLRAHRYGQPGVIQVFGNGILLGRIAFEHDTYPWEVFRFAVSEEIFRTKELELELIAETLEGEQHLPPAALLSFDWVELVPDPGARLRLGFSTELLFLSLPVALLLVLYWGGASFPLAGLLSLLTILVESVALARQPAHTTAALEHAPIAFLLAGFVFAFLRWPLGVDRRLARSLSAAFGFVLLAHSTIIFFPDHKPPDLGPHLGQIGKLASGWSWDRFWDFSSSFGEEGRGKPHFGADYEAPYPPWTYFLVHALRGALDHPRFWLELIGMTAGATLALLAFALASRLAKDERAPWFAFSLMSLEIATWHHASRVHTPGLVGEVFFVAAVTYLVFRYETLHRPRSFLAFTLLSLFATVAYTATLFHFAAFLSCFTAVELVKTHSLLPSLETRRAISASLLGTLGSFATFYHRFVGGALASRTAILAEEGYRAPATFYFLRNQMRDTARILQLGYPFFALLALPAYFRLPAWTAGELARKTIAAWTLSYALLLVLKDPLFFPQLLLHVKEDMLFAPLMCVLGAMTLSAAWRRGRAGRVFAIAVLSAFLVLQARDYLYNADTIQEATDEDE